MPTHPTDCNTVETGAIINSAEIFRRRTNLGQYISTDCEYIQQILCNLENMHFIAKIGEVSEIENWFVWNTYIVPFESI